MRTRSKKKNSLEESTKTSHVQEDMAQPNPTQSKASTPVSPERETSGPSLPLKSPKRKKLALPDPEPEKLCQPSPSTYNASDKLLCYFHSLMYDAVVLDVKSVEEFEAERKEDGSELPEFRSFKVEDDYADIVKKPEVVADNHVYFIHYANWGSRVRSDCLKPITEESRKEQIQLKRFVSEKNKRNKTKKVSSRKKRRWHLKRKPRRALFNAKSDTTDTRSNPEIPEDLEQEQAASIPDEKESIGYFLRGPTVTDALEDLAIYLASDANIRPVTATAFTKTVSLCYEWYCSYGDGLPNDVKVEIEKVMLENNTSKYGDVVNFSEINLFLEKVETGGYLSCITTHSSNEIVQDEVFYFQAVFEICKHFFSLSKRFWLEHSKYTVLQGDRILKPEESN